MSASSKVLLVLGAGGNIGASVASLFAQNGYKIALAARRLQDGINEDGNLHIQADFSHADSVESAFDKVSAQFGPPNVVVYNGASIDIAPLHRDVVLTVAQPPLPKQFQQTTHLLFPSPASTKTWP